MDNYFYKCPVCGFIHLVPAYWVNFAPEEAIEMEHLDMKQGTECTCQVLRLLVDE